MHEAKATTEVDELIGQRIRARRQELGLPMTHVAERLSITQQALQKYETGESRVSAAGLTRIAEVLQVDAAEPMRFASVVSCSSHAPLSGPGI